MIYDLIIIGGGPAGITAGIYACRQNLNTLMISKELGGQIAGKAVDICNFPGFERVKGTEFIERWIKHLQAIDIEIKEDEVVKIEKTSSDFKLITAKNKEFFAKSVIIATGADPRPLEAPGEKEFIGKGVSYCVTCDGPLFKNKTIAVVGGGNAGFEAAIFMENYADKIYILEQRPEVKVEPESQEAVKKSKKTEIITKATIKEIRGKKLVEELIYEDANKKEIVLKVQGVFIEIGRQPATSLAKGLVDFNEKDEIKVEFETFQTKTPGLFAAGDVNTGKYKQIVTAAGEGCKAALAAYQYVYSLKKNERQN